MLLFLAAAQARAAEPAAVAGERHERAPRSYANLRVGASSSSAHPELCLEVSPLELLGLEACGTGSGFLHNDPAPEIAHFRSKWKLTDWHTQIGWLQPRVGFGFAELQVGEDGAGFDFAGTGVTGVETAGPELGASVRALWPVWGGFELLGELNLSLGYFHHAPRLLLPQNRWQPSASFTLGFGF